MQEATATLNKKLLTRPSTPAQQISGSYRAQSASLNRPRVTPSRPVMSAGSRAKATQATSTVSLGVGDNSNNNARLPAQGNQSLTVCGYLSIFICVKCIKNFLLFGALEIFGDIRKGESV